MREREGIRLKKESALRWFSGIRNLTGSHMTNSSLKQLTTTDYLSRGQE